MSSKSYEIEGYQSEEHKKEVERWVSNRIYMNQTLLVEDAFKTNLFSIDDISNLYISLEKAIEMSIAPEKYNVDDEDSIQELENELGIVIGEPQEIFSWYLIDEWFSRRLEEAGEPILRNEYGVWWGRTTYGQLIVSDGVIQRVVWDIMNKSY